MNAKTFYFLFFCCLFFINKGFAQTADLTEGCIPLTVNFAPPAGVATYFWELNGAFFSQEENPENTFTTAGEHTMTFRENSTGAIIGSITITVFDVPELLMTADPASGCAPLTVAFANNSNIDSEITVNSYQWDFGDANSDFGQNVTHTYNNVGTYTVALEILTDFPTCNVTQIFNADDELIQVSQLSAAFITTPAVPSACEPPLVVNFTNTTQPSSDVTYSWDFGNGNTSVAATPPAQTYSTNGNFTVSLTATDAVGCVQSFETTVSIGTPTADFSINDTVCLNQLVEIDNLSSAGSYQWTYDPGTAFGQSDLTAINPTINFVTEGIHTVGLTVTTGNCFSDTSMTFFVEEADASFISDPSYSCSEPFTVSFDPTSDNIVDWQWNFSGQGIDSIETPTFTFNSTTNGEYDINGEELLTTILTVTTAAGCQATSSQTDILHRPNAEFISDLWNGCAPLDVTFSDSSRSNEPIANWEWNYDDGNTNTFTNGNPHTYTFTDPGEYDVVLIITNDAGCRDTSYSIRIEVGESITPDFSVDQTTVCPGDTVRFTDLTNSDLVDAWHYESEGGQLFHCFNEPNPFWIYNDSVGPQDVTLTVEYNGCYSSVTQNNLVTVNGPIANLDYNFECETPDSVLFFNKSQGYTSLLWNFGDDSTSTDENPIHVYASSGDYTVTLIAENSTSGCLPDTATTVVHIRYIEAIPNVERLQCRGIPIELNGTSSIDVHANCFRGYTWYFGDSGVRPSTTQDAIIEDQYTVLPDTGVYTLSLVVEDFNGCKDTATTDIKVHDIQASFTLDKDRICIPATVAFADLTTSDTTITSWTWDFGDFATSSLQNVTHDYISTIIEDGLSVNLTVENAAGCSSSTSLPISVYQPFSNVTVDDNTICSGEEINFSASDFTQEGSNLTFDWDFGNGQTDTLQNVSTTYNAEGTYTISLDVEEEATGCPFDTTIMIQVQDYPIANFTTDVDGLSVICFPEVIDYSDASTTNNSLFQEWDFGDGTTIPLGTTPTPTHTYDKGTFTTTLIVQTTFGCRDTVARDFTLVGPEGDFSMDNNAICSGESVTFTLINPIDVNSFSWEFGDGNSSDDVNPVTYTYNTAPPSGQVLVKLILRSEDGCETFVEQAVFIGATIANVPDTTICPSEFTFPASQGADTYSWDFGDGTTSTEAVPTHNYAELGTYTVTLDISNTANGCTDSATGVITVASNSPDNPVVAEFTDLGTICANDTIQFIDISMNADNWDWDFGDDSNNSILINPLHNYQEEGTYTVTLTATNVEGCSDVYQSVVNVVDALNPVQGIDVEICQGDTAILSVTQTDPDGEYTWQPGGNTTPSITVGNTTTTNFVVTLEDGTGCTSIDTVTLTVVPPFSNPFPEEPVCVTRGDDYIVPINDSLGLYSFIWSPEIDCPTCPFPVIPNIQEDIQYSILVTDAFAGLNCFIDTLTLDIFIAAGEDDIVFPNVFTPNGDEVNSLFNFVPRVGTAEGITVQKFEIYNRWGKKVYDNETPNQGWDGTSGGEDQPIETYIYIVELILKNQTESIRWSGDLTLLR